MPATEEKVLIEPTKCYTKSAYARKINKTPTWVGTMIKDGKLKIVKINGCDFIVDADEIN